MLLPLLLLPSYAFEDALDPAVLDDTAAQAQYPYLHRGFTCSAAERASLPSSTPSQVIHQIWWQGEGAIPPHFEPIRRSWRTHHKEWAFKLWDEKAIATLVNESYTWFAPTFHALPSNIQKADAARYVILHAEGGVYADLDVEAFLPFDAVTDAKETLGALLLFEEPATHWEAHGTVISNGLIASPQAHPLLLRLMSAIRPVAQVFASGGSHMLQERRRRPRRHGGGGDSCGCYVTRSSERFFPLHDGMRRPEEFPSTKAHAKALREFVGDVKHSRYPPEGSYCAQEGALRTCPPHAVYWTVAWIDPDIGRLFLEALAAARRGDDQRAEKLLYATLWSKWGTRYKYRSAGGAEMVKKAKDAYARSVDLSPDYSWGYYELANIALEAGEHGEALSLLQTALQLRPSDLLFQNNAGVAQLGLQQHDLAEASFRKVLELEATSFATIRGVAAKAGANVNLGIALANQGRQQEANAAYRSALDGSSFQYGLQAAQRLKEAGDPFSPQDELSVILGDALFKEGRTREAAIRFASAHQHAETPGIRERVASRMNALAEVWHTAGSTKAEARKAKPNRGSGSQQTGQDEGELPGLTIHQAGPDGKTIAMNLGKLTPELMEQLRKQGMA
ncbi:hypothetical protein AB1Y20_018013 [Prymnesium parvum]|uniref:Alpha-1,6-mannosyl-glycoprotein 6-beta-N-acetylglucosaminyltransferase n=1 Tax=Prymnesium parvum TaxID=97485 RepID=A0AB34JMU1_PRYPA